MTLSLKGTNDFVGELLNQFRQWTRNGEVLDMAKLLSAYGYQGDAMNLPVADVETAAPYYVRHMGFTVVEQDSGPGEPPNEDAIKRVILERDDIRIALAENGQDPEQNGGAFHRYD